LSLSTYPWYINWGVDIHGIVFAGIKYDVEQKEDGTIKRKEVEKISNLFTISISSGGLGDKTKLLLKFDTQIQEVEKFFREVIKGELEKVFAISDSSPRISVRKYERPEGYPPPERVGIFVHNHENSDLTNIYVKLIGKIHQVEERETDNWEYIDENATVTIDELNRRFALGNNLVIEPDEEKPFVLAKIQGTDIVFLFENKPYHAKFRYPAGHSGFTISKSRWEFEFYLCGKLNGKPFKEKFKTYVKGVRQVPTYQDESIIADKVSIEIGEIIHVEQVERNQEN